MREARTLVGSVRDAVQADAARAGGAVKHVAASVASLDRALGSKARCLLSVADLMDRILVSINDDPKSLGRCNAGCGLAIAVDAVVYVCRDGGPVLPLRPRIRRRWRGRRAVGRAHALVGAQCPGDRTWSWSCSRSGS